MISRLAEPYGVYARRLDWRKDGIEFSDAVLFIDRGGRLRKRVLPHVLQLSGRQDVEWLLEGHDHD